MSFFREFSVDVVEILLWNWNFLKIQLFGCRYEICLTLSLRQLTMFLPLKKYRWNRDLLQYNSYEELYKAYGGEILRACASHLKKNENTQKQNMGNSNLEGDQNIILEELSELEKRDEV